MRSLTLAATSLLGILLLADRAAGELPTNNDPTNQIRFNTPAEADAKRLQLTNYVWPNGLPTTSLPAVTNNVAFPAADLAFPNPAGACTINRSLVSSVDRLEANVSGWDFHSVSYLMHPTNTANAKRLVIVEAGHDFGLMTNGTGASNGLDSVINIALQNGFSVLAMQMPLYGWSPNATDKTAVLPGAGAVTFSSHDEMFNKLVPLVGGAAVFRTFLEPVVQNINYFEQTTPEAKDVSMIGLSGGGWTTHMAAAVDPRIKLSVPVAGSAPLYARNADPVASMGDIEQYYPPLYNENIAPDGTGGGVATWLETYALGGYGDGRRQIMVTNRYDQYFRGTFADSFKNIVSTKVSNELGKGKWDYFLDATHGDATHPEHLISSHVINNVIMPALVPAVAKTTTTRTETFATAENRFAPVRNPTMDGNNFGFSNTSSAGGASGAGEAGGLFARSGSVDAYADTHLGGAFGRNESLVLSGTFKFTQNLNFDGGVLVGYFDSVAAQGAFLGLGVSEPTSPGGPLRAVLQFRATDGSATFGSVVNINIGTSYTFQLTYTANADGSGTLSGTIAGTSVSLAGPPSTAVFNAFGIGVGYTPSDTAASQARAYFDDLTYNIKVANVLGDFDGDGDVDGADFVVWQTHFPTSSGATLNTGDADGDGDVDGADFVVWQTHFPTAPGSGASPVPEPSSLILVAGTGLIALVSQIPSEFTTGCRRGVWHASYSTKSFWRSRFLTEVSR